MTTSYCWPCCNTTSMSAAVSNGISPGITASELAPRSWHTLTANSTAPVPENMFGVVTGAAPAYAAGLVVAGFGSGELATMRAETGNVAWTDNLAAAVRSGTLADFSAIRGQ